jgi:drug/metabolite transporter (DMT)-like permease
MNTIFCVLVMLTNGYCKMFWEIYEKYEMGVPSCKRLMTNICLGTWVAMVNMAGFCAYIVALKLTDLDMFSTLSRCVIITTIMLEMAILKKVPNLVSLLACFLICAGGLLAGYDTLAVCWFGYALVMLTNLITSGYTIVQNLVTKYDKLRSFEMNCYLAFLGLLLTTIYCYFWNEFPYLLRLNYADAEFTITLIFISLGGIFLNTSKIAANVSLQPVTVSIVLVAVNLMMTGIGILTSSVLLSVEYIIGMSMSIVGILAYSLY